MKLYKRSEFIKLPANTIYSRADKNSGEIMHGLYCKTSDEDYKPDFVEQDLISEIGFPNNISNGLDAQEYVLNLRDTFQEFETDLECEGRDGMFDDEDVFVVWNNNDILKLINYLQKCLLQINQNVQVSDTTAVK